MEFGANYTLPIDGKAVLTAVEVEVINPATDIAFARAPLAGQAELDAAIIMPDVDVAAVAEKLFFGAFYNSAQICVATKRMYIHEAIYDELRDALAKLAKASVVGEGLDQGTGFGPIQNRPQFERMRRLIEGTREQGLVLPLLKFSDTDEAVARANASEYGLAGAVWSNDIEAAPEIANRLETGTVWINENLSNAPHIPFAGAKQSGFGVENGEEGLREYTWRRTVFIAKRIAG